MKKKISFILMAMTILSLTSCGIKYDEKKRIEETDLFLVREGLYWGVLKKNQLILPTEYLELEVIPINSEGSTPYFLIKEGGGVKIMGKYIYDWYVIDEQGNLAISNEQTIGTEMFSVENEILFVRSLTNSYDSATGWYLPTGKRINSNEIYPGNFGYVEGKGQTYLYSYLRSYSESGRSITVYVYDYKNAKESKGTYFGFEFESGGTGRFLVQDSKSGDWREFDPSKEMRDVEQRDSDLRKKNKRWTSGVNVSRGNTAPPKEQDEETSLFIGENKQYKTQEDVFNDKGAVQLKWESLSEDDQNKWLDDQPVCWFRGVSSQGLIYNKQELPIRQNIIDSYSRNQTPASFWRWENDEKWASLQIRGNYKFIAEENGKLVAFKLVH